MSVLGRKITIGFLFSAFLFSSAFANEMMDQATLINTMGSIAAGFNELNTGPVSEAQVAERFKIITDPKIMNIAQKWAKDEELRDSVPAFRRFLFFDYLTSETNIIVVASNPPETLINTDSDVSNVFSNYPAIITYFRENMTQTLLTPKSTEIDNHFVAIFPMIPAEPAFSSCIACHASPEVKRPYPKEHKVLGYTLVAIPKNQ